TWTNEIVAVTSETSLKRAASRSAMYSILSSSEALADEAFPWSASALARTGDESRAIPAKHAIKRTTLAMPMGALRWHRERPPGRLGGRDMRVVGSSLRLVYAIGIRCRGSKRSFG